MDDVGGATVAFIAGYSVVSFAVRKVKEGAIVTRSLQTRGRSH